jgi:hypothetical protein
MINQVEGLHWEYNGTIQEEPANKRPFTQTKLKPGAEKYFQTPLDAMLAIFPHAFLGMHCRRM